MFKLKKAPFTLSFSKDKTLFSLHTFWAKGRSEHNGEVQPVNQSDAE